ncbi:Cyclin-L2 [Dactylellina cionopaga]|nr:Cyclin-L2 [Dactylellina cionopaga]
MVSIFSAPLATPAQLAASPSQQAGIPEPLEQKLHLVASRLIQAAVLLQRYYLTTSIQASPLLQTCLASLYLSSKLTEHPQKPRDLINVFKYLLSPASPLHPPHLRDSTGSTGSKTGGKNNNKSLYYVPEGDYTVIRSLLLSTEAKILRSQGFNTTVQLPYALAFNYLQSLGVLTHSSESPSPSTEEGVLFNPLQHDKLVSTTFAYLTDILSSPSQLYLTHHPHELAVAGIYTAARDHGVKLPERWWEVWDVERETLGFLVVVIRGGTYIGGSGEVWIVEDGKFEDVEDGEVVAIGRDSVDREVERLRGF